MSKPQATRKSARLASKTPVAQHPLPASRQKATTPAATSSRLAKQQTQTRPTEPEETDRECTPPPRFAFKERFRKGKGRNGTIDASQARFRPANVSLSAFSEEIEHLKEIQREQVATTEFMNRLVSDHQKILAHLPHFPSEERFESLLSWFEGLEEKIGIRNIENERLRVENKQLLCEVDGLKERLRRLEASVREIREKIEGIPPRYQRRNDPNGRPLREWSHSPLSAEILPSPIDTALAERRGRSWRHATPIIIENEYSRESSADATVVSQEGTHKRRREEFEEDEPPQQAMAVADDTMPRPDQHASRRPSWMNTVLDDSNVPRPVKIGRLTIEVGSPPREDGTAGDRQT